MAKDKKFILKISCFSSKGEIFAAILPDTNTLKSCLKVWNTNNGNLLAEWKHSDEDSDVQFSCIACSFVGTKKRRKENGTCLVALGTDSGEVLTINATNGELNWKSSGHHHGCSRIVALSFANKGQKVCVISTDGTTCELNSETGELLKETKFSKKYISSSVYYFDQKDVRGKKRAASDADIETAGINLDIDHADSMDGVQIDDDVGAPTMGEKLASLNILNNEDGSDKKGEMSAAKPPSADSVHVLLKQALHAEDRALLLDCLSRQNEKVITNSVAFLNPSDVFKLLESLISVIQSRGSVVAFALPWLRSLLLQHASSIMSQESSLIALNSLYQLIESRVSTFNSALQLSSCLDLLYTKTIDGVDEEGPLEPIIYEDESDDDESEEDGDAMETDEEDNEELEAVSNVSDLEGSDGMIDY